MWHGTRLNDLTVAPLPFRDQAVCTGNKAETRKAVDRAKGILQEQLRLSEPDAFRWIQKTAMDLRLSMRQVAEGVIAHGPGIAAGSSD